MRNTILTFLAFLCLIVSTATFAAKVDINTADALTFATHVSGIGPSRAAAIVADREENGPFRSVADLARVNGIGLRLIEQNREILTISNDD